MWALPSWMLSKCTCQQAEGTLKIKVLFIFFIISPCLLRPSAILAQDDNDDIVFRLASAVEKLCALPSERGRILEYDGSVEGDVIVRLLGVKLRNPLILILFMDQWVVAGGLGGVGRLWWKKGRFRRVGLGT